MNDRSGNGGRSWWIVVGALSRAVAVVMGAWAAHGLDGVLQQVYPTEETRVVAGVEMPVWAKYLHDVQTAARYQMYHALVLIAVGGLPWYRCNLSRQIAGWCFLGGTVLFCGSLYLLALTGQTWLGMVAPVGGLLLIAGWLATASAFCPCGRAAVNGERAGESKAGR